MTHLTRSAQPLGTIVNYYTNLNSEATRLQSSTNIERLRTLDILSRFVPKNSVVLDVGGGAGIYAIPLAKQGHKVHFVDLVEFHVKQAQEASLATSCPLASYNVGDARQLNMFSDAFANVVMLLGPLYHLMEVEDRTLALSEAYRTCSPGGIVIVAGISRFASFCDGMKLQFLKDPEFVKIVREDLKTGKHINKTLNPNYFTDAYLHKPEELKSEVESVGFRNVRVLAVEGPSWLTDEKALEDTVFLEEVLFNLRETEEEPSLLGVSAHLIAVGQKM